MWSRQRGMWSNSIINPQKTDSLCLLLLLPSKRVWLNDAVLVLQDLRC